MHDVHEWIQDEGHDTEDTGLQIRPLLCPWGTRELRIKFNQAQEGFTIFNYPLCLLSFSRDGRIETEEIKVLILTF